VRAHDVYFRDDPRRRQWLTSDAASAMSDAGLSVTGTLDELLGQIDVVVDCTPKRGEAGS
jgi:hypothetical protein